MKIVVVGGVAGGASAAARLRRLDESADIVMLERGEHVSFSNCSLPYYLGGVIADSGKLIMMTPEDFKARFNIDVRVNAEVISIDRKSHFVTVRDTTDGTEYQESYDKLILATGAAALRPKTIVGLDKENVFTLKNVSDAVRLHDYLIHVNARDVAVIGGGFIGLEAAENLVKAGYHVALLEGMDQVMAPLDHDMAQILHKELADQGIEIHLNSTVTSIGDGTVTALCRKTPIVVRADAVVLAIGVVPETKLASDAGLTIGGSQGIKTFAGGKTDDPDIFAVGDASEGFDILAGRPGRLPLAGPAQRQARDAADAICGREAQSHGFIGTNCLRVFELNVAATGMNEKTAKNAGISFDYIYALPPDKVGIMPDSHYMAFKLLFAVPTGKILGAQAIGRGDVTKRIDVIATMITMNGTLKDLKDLELCYCPVYSTPKDIVNLAALIGLNVLSGEIKQIHVSETRALVESHAFIVDVREENEYQAGHMIGAINIPLSHFRERIEEIPRDIPVYLYCRTSQRSYYAIRILQGRGYSNAINISGSFLGVCLYEAFQDHAEGREPIVTAYNFK